tara:strand:+ start:11 stop:691 length:681 start_codon:yes stop_codon:yes gene_type:complete
MPYVTSAPRVVRANRRFDGDADHPKAHHGWFYSWKLSAQIPYRGTLANVFLSLAEAHPAVLHTLHRTDPIDWWDGTAWRQYHPRYRLVLKTRTRGLVRHVDVEVISKQQLERQAERYRRIKREFRFAHRILTVLTGEQLLIEPRNTNVQFILSQAGDGIATDEERSLILQIAIATRRFSLNEIVAAGTLSYARAYCATLNLVATGELKFGLGRLFDGDTPIWRAWQ